MPRLSVWALRAAMIHFSFGFSFGALMLANKGISISAMLWRLLPLHIEFLLVGWIVQLVFGIAYWIFPRYKFPPKRGREELVWASLVLLNLGVMLVAVSVLAGSQAVLLASRIAEALSILLFAISLWQRAKPTEIGRQKG